MSSPKPGRKPSKQKGKTSVSPAVDKTKRKPRVTQQGDFAIIEAEGASVEDVIAAVKTAKKRAAPDWETIEGQYRANVLSLRIIGTQHGITEGAIRKKAKAEGWQRDLAAKVRKQAKEELVRSDGTQSVRNAGTQQATKEVERQAVQTIVTVVRNHRSILKRGYDVLEGLLAELQETADNRSEIEAAIDEETAADKDGKRKAMMQRAIALPSRTGVMLNLSAAMKNVIALERQAFNIDDAPQSGDDGAVEAMAAARNAKEAAERYADLIRQ